jgi:GDP-4-dehydro-6-deoxy-D-mannose reductase
MRILITGAAGFVGSRLAQSLVSRGHEVVGTFIKEALPLEGVHLEEVDLLDLPSLRRVVDQSNPEAIVHLAGLSHVGESWKVPEQYFQVNVLGTENLLRASGDRRTIVASSAEVYGSVPDDRQPIGEATVLAPRSPYAMTKAAAERLALERDSIVVRSFNILGPGQAPIFALPAFAEQLRDIQTGGLEPVVRVGNLSARRDFLDLSDAIEGYCAILEQGEAGECYNLGSGIAVSIRQMLDCLLKISGVEARVEVEASRLRSVDVPLLCADNRKLRGLGWVQKSTPEAALEDLWKSVSELSDQPR